MKKSRTNKRRSQRRLTRRRLSRRQRGGATVKIEVDNYQGGPVGLVQLTIEENSSIRNVLKQWIQESTKLPADNKGVFLRYAEKKPVPNFQFFDETGKLVQSGDWDSPYTFKNGMRYKFLFSAKQQAQNNFKAKIEDSTEYLVKAILHYAGKGTPAKIIPYSHSTDADDIKKNVKQTFKFQANPKTPIILYDIAWFEEGFEPWQFYNLLEFETWEDSTIGPGAYVKFYKKPAGVPFTIKGDRDLYKRKYLRELQRQASEARFDELSEVEICCVKWKSDNNDPKMREKEERIFTVAERTGSPMYSFQSEGHIPDFIEGVRALRGLKKNSNTE